MTTLRDIKLITVARVIGRKAMQVLVSGDRAPV